MSTYDNSTESHDGNRKLGKSTDSLATSSRSLIDLFHSQTKQIVSAVLTLTRQNENDESGHLLASQATRSLSPLDDKQQMELVKNIAIAVRDLLQTLDYAPMRIKEMVNFFEFTNIILICMYIF